MSDYLNVINEYMSSSYECLRVLDDKGTVQLARNKIDNINYVVKIKNYYDINVYQRLKRQNIDGIPKVYELIETEKGLIVIEEFVPGENLDEYISRRIDEFDNAEQFIIDIIRKVGLILEKIHSQMPPIIHRDIKPQNILMYNDQIYLIDFNIAREYEGQKEKDTFAMGTKEYAAPEQYGFSESDARTDIYGIGATIKYMCKKLNVNTIRLNAIMEKAMEMDPDNRFQSVKELLDFIESKNNISVVLKKYALPGFRKKNILHMVIALIYYALFIFISLGFKMDPNKYEGFYAKLYDFMGGFYIFVLAMFFALFNNNYLNIQSKTLRRIKTNNTFLRLLIILAVDVGFAILSFMLYSIIVVIIFELGWAS